MMILSSILSVTAFVVAANLPLADANQNDEYGCFSGNARVNVANKGIIHMADVQVNDYIMTGKMVTGKNANKVLRFQPVYAFAHYDPYAKAEFVSITTHHNPHAALEVMGHHFVYVKYKWNPVRADSIQVGDILVRGGGGAFEAPVTNVTKVIRRGLFAPLTREGSIVVNGLVASTYSSFHASTSVSPYVELQWGIPTMIPQNLLLHMTLTPFRFVCTKTTAFCHYFVTKEDGRPYALAVAAWFAQWADRRNLLLQLILLILFIPILVVAVTSWLAEVAFEFMLDPFVIIASIIMWFILLILNYNRHRRQQRQLQSLQKTV